MRNLRMLGKVFHVLEVKTEIFFFQTPIELNPSLPSEMEYK